MMEPYEILPPGFRFHPTDEELIIYYLRNQATSKPCPVPIIPELNIYKFDPWELPGKSDLREGEWYFFSPRDRKYPNGTRPNRATASGYWKATGTDKPIHSNGSYVGMKKALVFYRGRPPRGGKTEWIMHEYRLGTSDAKPAASSKARLGEWVLCRIYQKRHPGRTSNADDEHEDPSLVNHERRHSEDKVPTLLRPCSLAHLLEHDCILGAPQLLDDSPLCSLDDVFSAGVSVFDANTQPMSMDPIFQH